MKPNRHIALFVLTSLCANASAIDCNASFIINSQQDATALNDCAAQQVPINGNVTIGPGAVGAIEFRNFGLINGSIIAQDNPSLTSLSFESDDPNFVLDGWIHQIILQNLTAFTSLSFPSVWIMPGDVVFEDLPSLEMVNLSALDAARDIRLKNLPKLQTFLTDSDFGVIDNIEVEDIGIDSIDWLLRIGLVDQVSVDGIPNVKNLSYSLARSGNVSIHGSGNLQLNFNCTLNDMTDEELTVTAGSMTVSGLSTVSRNDTEPCQVENLVVGTFNATQNSFTHLPIDFAGLTSPYIIDNPNLTTLSYYYNFTNYGWEDIVISGNPNLKLNSTTGGPYSLPLQTLTSTWVWPSVDVSSMTFDGPFDNGFFQPFIDLGQDKSERSRVLDKFIIKSSLGPDQFNCTGLNGLRKAGILQEEYSCQNQTVKDESGVGRLNHGIDLPLLLLFIGLGIFFRDCVIF